MYPYFLIGYVYKKNNMSMIKFKYLILIISLVMFKLLLLRWKKDYYIYTTGMSLYNTDIINKLLIIGYRYITGFVGSILIINIYECIYKFDDYKIFINLGKNTLGVYIIQSYIMLFVIRICLLIINLISKNETIKRILLGSYKKSKANIF